MNRRPAILVLAAVLAGCAAPADRDVLYQVSTVDALLEGAYDGTATLAQVLKRGDVGLGTFDALDGEMVVLEGCVYQVRSDGCVRRPALSETTPFAAVTFFEADHVVTAAGPMDLAGLERLVDRAVATPNIPHAIRVDGEFAYVKTRSVPRQTRPYPRLAEVAAHQPTFDLHDVRGTLVGFRCPKYVAGLNVPGYHLHFLTDDRSAGGHVLEVRLRRGTVAIDDTFGLEVALPRGGAFYRADLAGEKGAEIERIEK